MIRLTLPYPPTLNSYYRHVVIDGNVRVLISAKGRQYRADVLAHPDVYRARRFGTARLRVAMCIYPPDKRRRDLDGVAKGLLDALTHADLWDDDSQIDLLTIRRGEVLPGGALELTIEAMR